MSFELTDAQLAQYAADGYVLVQNLFDAEEMDLLIRIARADHQMTTGGWVMKDAAGRGSRLNLRHDSPRDIYSAFVHDARVIDLMTRLLNGPIYHWHHKMMLKEPRVGGAWEWHQDYGYWYGDNCLYPDLASCMIAVDRAYKGNGCLQVLRGSHRLGRVEHGKFGEQVGADPKRVKAAMDRLELVYCEMEPGTALFFHSNLLHCSAPNTSEDPRWSLICCYNAMHNAPFEGRGHGKAVEVDRWPAGSIRQIGKEELTKMEKGEVQGLV